MINGGSGTVVLTIGWNKAQWDNMISEFIIQYVRDGKSYIAFKTES